MPASLAPRQSFSFNVSLSPPTLVIWGLPTHPKLREESTQLIEHPGSSKSMLLHLGSSEINSEPRFPQRDKRMVRPFPSCIILKSADGDPGIHLLPLLCPSQQFVGNAGRAPACILCCFFHFLMPNNLPRRSKLWRGSTRHLPTGVGLPPLSFRKQLTVTYSGEGGANWRTKPKKEPCRAPRPISLTPR